jgi:hypothetical protein
MVRPRFHRISLIDPNVATGNLHPTTRIGRAWQMTFRLDRVSGNFHLHEFFTACDGKAPQRGAEAVKPC